VLNAAVLQVGVVESRLVLELKLIIPMFFTSSSSF